MGAGFLAIRIKEAVQLADPVVVRLFGVLLVSVVLAVSCSAPAQEAATASTQVSVTSTTAVAEATTTTAPLLDGMGPGTWVATAKGDGISAYTSDDFSEQIVTSETLTNSNDEPAADWWFPAPTQFGGPRVFLVVNATEQYLEVQLPIRPNGSTGWIKRSDVTLSEVTMRAEVNLTEDSLTVWDGDEVIVETRAVTGKEATPTPVGEFFVRDVIPSNPTGAYGSFILGLSGFSETLETFNGALPAIAIHGTNNPDQIGSELSNGCVRIPNDLVELLAETVPLGTPVSVVA